MHGQMADLKLAAACGKVPALCSRQYACSMGSCESLWGATRGALGMGLNFKQLYVEPSFVLLLAELFSNAILVLLTQSF